MLVVTPKIQPVDSNGYAIGTLAYGRNASLSFIVTTTRVELPTTTVGREDVFRLAANQNCYVNFGDDTVVATATDIYFPAGVETIKVPDQATHIAVIRESADGVFSVTEMR